MNTTRLSRRSVLTAAVLTFSASAAAPALAATRGIAPPALPARTELIGSLVPGGKAVVRTDAFAKGEKVAWELTLGTDVINSADADLPRWYDGMAAIDVDLSATKANTTYTLTAVGLTSKKSITVSIAVGKGDGPTDGPTKQPSALTATVISVTSKRALIEVSNMPKACEYAWELSGTPGVVNTGSGRLKGSQTTARIAVPTADLAAGTYEFHLAVLVTRQTASTTFTVKRGQTPTPKLPRTGN